MRIKMDRPHLCLPTLRYVYEAIGGCQTGLSAAAKILELIEEEEKKSMKSMEVYHFGVWGESPGHFTHGENGRRLDYNHVGPWHGIDGRLPPGGRYKDVEGAAALHYYDVTEAAAGADLSKRVIWTAIAFWDRSGDERGNSNTAFFVARKCSFQEMCDLAKERYPDQWKRLNVRPYLVQTFDEEWSKVYSR